MTNLELKYAPRKCKHFVCGDCSISGRTCMSDYPECKAAELQEENETLKRTCQDWGNTVTELRAEIEDLKRENKLLKDWKYLTSKDRPLNSFEQGIKAEVERLLNEQI